MLRIRIRDPVPFWPLDPGSGIGFFRIPDPNPYFWELSDSFLGKKFYNSLKIGPNFFLQHFKTKIMYNFLTFVATLKEMTSNFFSPLSFVAVFGSGMGKNQDLGSGINIPDPQHWLLHTWYFHEALVPEEGSVLVGEGTAAASSPFSGSFLFFFRCFLDSAASWGGIHSQKNPKVTALRWNIQLK